jgi:hypothetical protein
MRGLACSSDAWPAACSRAERMHAAHSTAELTSTCIVARASMFARACTAAFACACIASLACACAVARTACSACMRACSGCCSVLAQL